MPKAGGLRHKLEIWQPVDTVTGKGDTVITYIAADEPYEYASVEPIAGRELLFARQVRADVTHKITMRHRSDITHRTQFIWWDGYVDRKFNVGPFVDSEYKHVQMSFYAIEIYGDGRIDSTAEYLVWGGSFLSWGP